MKTINQTPVIPGWLKNLHHRLLPQSADVGFMPYIWLGYLLMYFIPFVFNEFSTQQYIYSFAGIAVFLVLYFRAYWVADRQLFYYITGIWAIGFVLALLNMPTAGVFTVYAAAFCAQFNSAKNGFTTLGIMLAMTSVAAVGFGISAYIIFPALFFGAIIGVSNIYLAQMAKKNQVIKASQEEIKNIATAAERERIARDLHDLIGHTFSVINIKSQLAQKLVGHDNKKVQQEIREIEKISRESLAEVREVVSDYRQRDLATELVQARVLLNSLDIEVTEHIAAIEDLQLDSDTNTAMAYMVRELTTNIMRHSKATECMLKLETDQQHITLIIKDNGQANDFKTGSGLKGVSERVAQLNGRVDFNIDQGFMATITLPISNQVAHE
ncbi:sensor histidine kinase [Marinicella gelatinilytica]|uniref:sensor histidine kinase n=1 Tax=Marinicella gelatinilytica TaxID=2996017 RepID=UPI0022609D8B|nr:sensor histidine kinase [Marinicella gelatinilytica]MCX7544656.1 sensor histidine kinase [Marinicella gelatinilytica]